jgi:hypothetical protein
MLDHLSYVGWSTFIYACYRVVRFTFNAGSLFTTIKERALDGEQTLHNMATNHLPHLQLELEKQNAQAALTNQLLTELRSDLKEWIRQE